MPPPRPSAIVLVLLVLLGAGCAAVPARPPLAVITSNSADTCRAIDGDTIDCAGVRVRILNIDTPELGAHARCPAEADLADQARQFTGSRLAAGAIEIRPDPKRPRDRYGRTLARVLVDGRDLGEDLIAAGLARAWDGSRRPWCP